LKEIKVVAIIQARMASSRLPEKVLLDIAGQPMLAHVVERARGASSVDQVVVATTVDPADDAVAAFCLARNYPFTRGSLHDVLDRYYQAARLFQAGVVVRLTADCPLIDPGLIDETVKALYKPVMSDQSPVTSNQSPQAPITDHWSLITKHWDFTTNRLPPPWGRTYPIGLDVEVCTFAALERAWREADQSYQREHVMPYLYENDPVIDSRSGEVIATGRDISQRRGFRVLLLNSADDHGALRWTVDTPADMELIRQVFARLEAGGFHLLEVLDLPAEPELAGINAGIQHKGFQDVDMRSMEHDL
jgi:spore coat polysaccharide biosynthesis protein SpsF